MAMEDSDAIQVNGSADHSIGEVTPQLEGEQLKQALLKQLEYYFSRENLEKDDFLKSQMNAEFFVPIHVIAAFKMVRNLTTDIGLIVEVLRTSKEVVVSESGESVRPQMKTQRSTLILRDISSETPLTEIEEIFKHEGCAPVKKIKPEIGNTWFVSFETEQEALATLTVLRTLSFKGQTIQARVKTENPLKNLLAPAEPYIPNPAPYFAPWNGYYDSYDPTYQGNGKHSRNPNNRPPRNRNPRPDQATQAQNQGQGQGQPQQHRESGNRGSREGRENRENRPEGRSDSKPELRSGEGRAEPRGPPRAENRGFSGENSREGGSARKGAERSLPPPSKDGQEGAYKPRSTGQGKRGAPGQASGKTSPGPQKSESQPRGKPRNVPMGPESFPPLPGAISKNQEFNLTLNYSAVAHAGADKPVQNERQPPRRTASHENAEKKPSAGKPEAASSSEELEAPVEKEKEPETPTEAKDEAEPGKGQLSSRSYAEILRAKAALREQSASTASPPSPPAEEAAGEAAPAPSAASAAGTPQHRDSRKSESSGRGNRSQNGRRNNAPSHKESHIEIDSEGFQRPVKSSRARQDRSERYKERAPRTRSGDDSAHTHTPAAAEAAPAHSE